ncbi:MAG: carboxypeptidase-like regulatory domain-containing protein, partial [Pyrinomonadaceae bacterium]
MRKFTSFLIVAAALMLGQMAIHGQTTGSIAGTVTDQNGALVPGAMVKIKGAAGQEWSTVTNDSGGFRVPSIQNGVYVVTITATGFKTSTVTNVKVDVGTPVTVDAKLEIGNVGEIVEISSGGEVLQTETAA